MTAAEQIAEFAAGLRYEDIPEPVRERAARHLLDAVGCALGSGAHDAAQQARDWARRNDSHGGPAELWTAPGETATAASAALANGMAAHGMDFDDTHADSLSHIFAVNAPAAVAVAQQTGASGAELIAALVAAAETTIRIGLAAPGAFHAVGLHPTSVCGVFGATVAVGRLLGLDRARMVSALGVAGSQASGLFEYLADGSMTKPFHAGWAAHAAVIAAGLAELGTTGPATVLEGRYGMYRAVLGQDRDEAIAAQLSDLGDRWETLQISIKLYPACHLTHAGMDAARSLLRDGVTPGDVASIHVEVGETTRDLVLEPAARKRAPATPYEAKFSLPFCVGRMLVDGQVGASSFAPDMLGDDRVLALSDPFTYGVVGAERGPFYTALSATLRDGTQRTVEVAHPSGTPQAPATAEQVMEKFTALAEPQLGPEGARATAERILSIADDPGPVTLLPVAVAA